MNPFEANIHQAKAIIIALKKEINELRTENQKLHHVNATKEKAIKKIREHFHQMQSAVDKVSLSFQEFWPTSNIPNNNNMIIAQNNVVITSNGDQSTLHVRRLTFEEPFPVQQQNHFNNIHAAQPLVRSSEYRCMFSKYYSRIFEMRIFILCRCRHLI